MCLVFDIPAERLEEGIQKIDPYLRFGIAFGEIVVLVLFELGIKVSSFSLNEFMSDIGELYHTVSNFEKVFILTFYAY